MLIIPVWLGFIAVFPRPTTTGSFAWPQFGDEDRKFSRSPGALAVWEDLCPVACTCAILQQSENPTAAREETVKQHNLYAFRIMSHGSCSQVASETAGGEEMKEGEEPDEEDLEEAEEPEELEEPRSRTSVEAPNFLSETFQEVQTRSEGQSAQIAEAQAAAEDMERGDDTENEKWKEQESTDEEAGGDAEVAEDAETAKPLVLAEVPPEQAGSSTAMSGEHQNPDHEENEDIRSRMHLEGQ